MVMRLVALMAVVTVVAAVGLVTRGAGEGSGGGEQQNCNDGKSNHDLDSVPD